jgi:hypothetical protein
MRPRSVSATAFSLAFLAIVVLAGACNNQGEGDICDINAGNNGDNDCQSGLDCVSAPGAMGSPNPYRCCPTDLTQASSAVCMLSGSSGNTNTAAPVADASSDASIDAPLGDDGTSDATIADGGAGSPEATVTDALVEGSAASAIDAAAE